jgi:hypothetical protein
LVAVGCPDLAASTRSGGRRNNKLREWRMANGE